MFRLRLWWDYYELAVNAEDYNNESGVGLDVSVVKMGTGSDLVWWKVR